MLPASRRIRRADEYRSVMGSGTRAASRTVVVHVGPVASSAPERRATAPADPSPPPSARAGFIVGRSVHRSAVVRNQVARRLRHVMSTQLDGVPAGLGVVVRALPPASSASSAELEVDVVKALGTCLRRVGQRPDPVPAVSL